MNEDLETLAKRAYALGQQWLEGREAQAFDEATEILRRLLQVLPDSESRSLQSLLALLYYENEDYDQAIPYFRILSELSPENEHLSSNLAFALGCAGKIDESLDVIESYLSSFSLGNEYLMVLEDELKLFSGLLREGKLDGHPHVKTAIKSIMAP